MAECGARDQSRGSGVGLELQSVLKKSPLLAGGTQRTQLDPERCLLLVLGLVGILQYATKLYALK